MLTFYQYHSSNFIKPDFYACQNKSSIISSCRINNLHRRSCFFLELIHVISPLDRAHSLSYKGLCNIKLASLLFFILFWVTVLTFDSASSSCFISKLSMYMLSMCCSSLTNAHKDPLFTSSRTVSQWTRVLQIFYFRWDCGVSGFWSIAGRFGSPSNMEES